jgi:hypothetical protein
MSSLQDSHHDPQKKRRTDFPFKEEREVDPPCEFLRVKGGASFFGGSLWTPKEEHEGQSEGGGGLAAKRRVTAITEEKTVQHRADKMKLLILTAILHRIHADTCLDA